MTPDRNVIISAAGIAANSLLQYMGPAHLETGDIELEALLHLHQVSGRSEYLDPVLARWEARKHVPTDLKDLLENFSCLPFEICQLGKDPSAAGYFTDMAETLLKKVARDSDGAIATLDAAGTYKLSVENFHGYVLTMAKAAWLSSNINYMEEAHGQCMIFRQVLLDKGTGLWHRGRGWQKEPSALAPVFWLRAQSLVMHTLSTCLLYLPATYSGTAEIKGWCAELADVLIKYQDARGMWHQLVDKPGAYPETGGTALLAESLYQAVQAGCIPGEKYLPLLEKTVLSLTGFLHRDGRLANASPAFSPATLPEDYIHQVPALINPYAAAAFILACTAAFMPLPPAQEKAN